MRLDRYLHENGFAESRTKAASMIAEGIVFCNDTCVIKASFDVPEGASVELRGEALKYVSRGGLKLEGALQSFGIDPHGMIAVDLGASTGGFTDCLLQHGCKKVYAIDSGTAQLHPKLACDPRVISFENCNARYLTPDVISDEIDLIVCDLSFISQTMIHSVVASILKKDGVFISLIKPQFEVGREGIGKGGIVKNEKIRLQAIARVTASANANQLTLMKTCISSITGGDGNIEYLAYFIKR